MDLDEIRRLQDDWVAAATTTADLGYDIVYAYGAHGTAAASRTGPASGWSCSNGCAAVGDRCLVAGRIAAENFSDVAVSADDTLRVLTPEAVMADGIDPAGRVVVWDGDGGAIAAGLAEMLASERTPPVLASGFDRVAPVLDATFEGGTVRRRLRRLGVETRLGLTPTRFVDGELVLRDHFGDETAIEAATLVVVARRASDDRLYQALRADDARLREAGIRHVWRVGDCVAPRPLGSVVADGHRLGREIESEDAATPADPRAERDVDAAVVPFG